MSPLGRPRLLPLPGSWNTNDHWPIHSWARWCFEFEWSSHIKAFQSTKLTFTGGILILFVPLVSFPPQSQLLLTLQTSVHLSLLWKSSGSPQPGGPPSRPSCTVLYFPNAAFLVLLPVGVCGLWALWGLVTVLQQQEGCQVRISHPTNICRMNEWNGFTGQSGVELTHSKLLLEQYQKWKGYLHQEFLIQLN